MAEINLIKIEGKPLEKLIEVISNGIGTLYKPRAIKKEADAKAYEISVLEHAKGKALSEGKILEFDTLDRIQERTVAQEIKRQNNIDNISEIAAQQLSTEGNVSEEEVNTDWATRFFNIAEDISDEEMQSLWGKILAGEVKQPNSYSLRTLELVKNLTRKEAEVFNKVANFVISSHNSPFIFKGKQDDVLEKYNITFEDILLLGEIGLLQKETNISRSIRTHSTDYEVFFTSGNVIISSLKKANTDVYKINILRLTKIGEELLKLVEVTPNMQYLKEFCSELQNENMDTKYTYIVDNKGGQIGVSLPWLRF